jgi:transposase
LLYVCAMQAKRYNAACAEMFTRLKDKGKNGKLAIVAVANKLVSQAFAIATTSKYYEAKLVP